jgi:hypothetical protein
VRREAGGRDQQDISAGPPRRNGGDGQLGIEMPYLFPGTVDEVIE